MKYFTILILMACLATTSVPGYAQDAKANIRDEALQKIEQGDYAGAERMLKAQIASDKKDVVAYVLLGDLYRLKGDRRNAVKFLRKAIAIDADYAPAHLVLGNVYVLLQKDGEAVKEFRLFKEKMSGAELDAQRKAYYVRSLHDIVITCFSIKKYDMAKEALDEILRLEPQDQEAFYNMGVYQYRYKRNRSEAYRAFSKAAEIDANSAIARKAKYAIEFMRSNPDARVEPDFSFIDNE